MKKILATSGDYDFLLGTNLGECLSPQKVGFILRALEMYAPFINGAAKITYPGFVQLNVGNDFPFKVFADSDKLSQSQMRGGFNSGAFPALSASNGLTQSCKIGEFLKANSNACIGDTGSVPAFHNWNLEGSNDALTGAEKLDPFALVVGCLSHVSCPLSGNAFGTEIRAEDTVFCFKGPDLFLYHAQSFFDSEDWEGVTVFYWNAARYAVLPVDPLVIG